MRVPLPAARTIPAACETVILPVRPHAKRGAGLLCPSLKKDPSSPKIQSGTPVLEKENLESNVRNVMAEIICPTAKNSLLPYLSGRLDGTGEGAEFEEHVKQCEVCRELVSDRRRALQALIAAAEQVETNDRARPVLPGMKSSQVRLLAVSATLAAALIAISYFVNPSSSLLGEKLGATLQVEHTPTYKNSGPPPDTRARFEEVEESTSSLAVEATPPPPEIPAEPEPPPIAPKKRHKPPVNRVVPPAPNRIEVYDKQGNKVGETIQPR